MAITTKILVSCLILTVSLQMSCGSAIPIWEFLTRNEKMSYLYGTFAQLVSVHCKATAASSSVPVNQCKRNLLGYGYEKLQTFSDMQLDTFDPYQRGASELIWSSIMRNHPSSTLITTRTPLPTPPASSIVILTHQQPIKNPQQQQPSTPASAIASASTTSAHHYGKNPIFETGAEHKHQYAMDMDMAYGYPAMSAHPQVETFVRPPQQQMSPTSGNTATTQQQQQTYLTGPLVFRVRPDGTPVEEDQHKPLPRDDDLEDSYRHITAGSSISGSSSSSSSNSNSNNNGHQNKHRRIATISALKQQHLATLALQQQLQPPLQQTAQQQQQRLRRQFQVPVSKPMSTSGGYFYGRA